MRSTYPSLTSRWSISPGPRVEGETTSLLLGRPQETRALVGSGSGGQQGAPPPSSAQAGLRVREVGVIS